jgi:hypothetical protein
LAGRAVSGAELALAVLLGGDGVGVGGLMVRPGAGIAVALWLAAVLGVETNAGAAVPPVPVLQLAIRVRAPKPAHPRAAI